ncbi:hypothetical protein [Nocardioides xinjiangensis]|uniref:hypothetical protein n=1 Tax=Nocardioides xinjiangensis TaxID=2817376 RepID=UPI001B312584|nr:hypothetical protein [Nocardioides sp. SYSU D00514]
MTTTTEVRPAGMRILSWFGIVVLLGLGVPLTGMGLLGLHTTLGRGFLCAGLVLLVAAVGGVAREVVELQVRRDPPRARLATLDGEGALHLPRATGPTLVSSGLLAGLAAVAALGAVFAALDEGWLWTIALGLVAAWVGWSSAIHLGGRFAGGLWLTPTRLRHEDRGVAVEVPWDDVTGVVPQQPMPVLVRPDRTPTTTRTGPRGRAWKPVTDSGTLRVDTRYLAGGSTLASYVIAKAVAEPASRPVLGTRDSLPPA